MRPHESGHDERRMTDRRCLFFVLAFATLVWGCHRQRGPERVPTVPVRGLVTVNGLPAADLTVRLHALDGPEGEAGVYTAHPYAQTDGDGTFELSTYEQGDGVAAGTYAVTFEWLTYNALQNTYGKPDRLGGRYADPETTGYEITVTGDEETGIDLEPFRLEK